MKIKKTEYYTELSGRDIDGRYVIRIHSDGSQIQMETDGGDSYVNTDLKGLKDLRDAITEIINKI